MSDVPHAEILDDDEVKRRLRLHQQPICYFGESAEDRRERLLHFEKNNGVDYGKAEQSHKNQHERFLQKARKEQEEEEQLLRQQESEQSGKNPLATRMWNLRMKSNQCKRQNLEEVVQESNRERYEDQRKEKGLTGKWFKNKKQIRAEERDIEVTAEAAEKIEDKRAQKRKHKPTDGWEIHTDEALFRAYNKRFKAIPYETKQKMVEEYEKTKGDAPAIAIDIQYGNDDNIDESKKDRMVKELQARQEKREQFSRRRQFNEDEDVTYINDFNRTFNKKVGRAFDKYTKEIKANLERGTAL